MGTMHLIIVADLLDPNIGDSCGVDLRAVRELFQQGASEAGLGLQVTQVTGESFGAAAITAAVLDVVPEKNDVVVFYYSGHGARGESKPDAWPVLSLGSPAPPYDCFDLASIYQALHKKCARMLLMFVDCCQQLVSDDMLNECGPTAMRGILDVYSTTNYRLLFQMFQGEVLLMSCKPGQLSGCTPRRGGFFTATFLETILATVRDMRTATWENIARIGSTPPREDQEPIWKVVPAAQMSGTHPPGMEPFPGNWRLGQATEAKPSFPQIAPLTTPMEIPMPMRSRSSIQDILKSSEDQFARALKQSEDDLARLKERLKR